MFLYATLGTYGVGFITLVCAYSSCHTCLWHSFIFIIYFLCYVSPNPIYIFILNHLLNGVCPLFCVKNNAQKSKTLHSRDSMSPHPQAKLQFRPSELGLLGEADDKELFSVTGPPEVVVPFLHLTWRLRQTNYVYGRHIGDFECWHVSIVCHTIILIHNSFGRFGRLEIPGWWITTRDKEKCRKTAAIQE
jgi:hypothetical protein